MQQVQETNASTFSHQQTQESQNIQNHGFPLQHLPRPSCRDWAWPPMARTFHRNWLSFVGFIGLCFVQSITTKVSKLVRFNTLTTVEHTKVSFADLGRVPALSSKTLPEKCGPCGPYPGMELFGTAHNDHMSPGAALQFYLASHWICLGRGLKSWPKISRNNLYHGCTPNQ